MTATTPIEEFETAIRRDSKTGIAFSEIHRYLAENVNGNWTTAQYHRADGPAIVYRDRSSGDVLTEHHYVLGKLHRIDGPASIQRDPTTRVVTSETYAVDGKLHRIDGPAQIDRDARTGKLISEAYHLNGSPHRIDGPAFVAYDRDGNPTRCDYYIHGRPVSKHELPNLGSSPRSELDQQWRGASSRPAAPAPAISPPGQRIQRSSLPKVPSNKYRR